jgi:thiol-disulfide isomerase/thioredoxin
MNAIEIILLDSGLSWTISKLLPYLLMILLGLMFLIFSKRFLTRSKLIVRILIKLSFLIIPFVFYFAYFPIYEGDFSNNSMLIEKGEAEQELQGRKLVVLSIPNCPYCFSAIDKMIKLKERVPSIEIEYIVCNSNSETMKWYQDKAGVTLNVKMADSIRAMMNLASHSFPSFVLVENDKMLRTWSNDNFGVSALDEVELSFN